MRNAVNRALAAEKKHYFQPTIDVMSIGSIDTICAASATKSIDVKEGSFEEESLFS